MVMVKGFFYSIAAESIESLFELVILVSASGDGGSLRRLIVTWYLGAVVSIILPGSEYKQF